jgi:hypothetical protein
MAPRNDGFCAGVGEYLCGMRCPAAKTHPAALRHPSFFAKGKKGGEKVGLFFWGAKGFDFWIAENAFRWMRFAGGNYFFHFCSGGFINHDGI